MKNKLIGALIALCSCSACSDKETNVPEKELSDKVTDSLGYYHRLLSSNPNRTIPT